MSQQDFTAISQALGLFASCIKSGENWSPSCQDFYDNAKVSLENLKSKMPAEGSEDPQMFTVPLIPTEAQWGGLARQIVFWMDLSDRATPRSLFKHLERSGIEIPQWLRDEPEMKNLDHVPSKGTRAVIIYKAMLLNYGNSESADT